MRTFLFFLAIVVERIGDFGVHIRLEAWKFAYRGFWVCWIQKCREPTRSSKGSCQNPRWPPFFFEMCQSSVKAYIFLDVTKNKKNYINKFYISIAFFSKICWDFTELWALQISTNFELLPFLWKWGQLSHPKWNILS